MFAMIIDDEPLTREVIKNHLPWSELGFDSMLEAENGEAALQLIAKYPIDVIISDIKMPIMNGIEFVSAIRTMNINCQIIFISGYCEKEHLKSAIRLGAVDFIEKPLKLSELWQSVKKAVSLCCVQQPIQNKSLQLEQANHTRLYSPSIINAIKYIHENYQSSDISIKKIAQSAYLSEAYLCSLFKKELSITVNNYLHVLRMKMCAHMLKDKTLTLTDIAGKLGYGNANYLAKIFKKHYMITPSEYREKACGVMPRFELKEMDN